MHTKQTSKKEADTIFKGCGRYIFARIFFSLKRALVKLGKMFFISPRKLFLFPRKSTFSILNF